MPGLLAVDQATRTGWAWCEPGKEPLWGSLRMGKPGAWHGVKYWEFRNFLIHKIGLLSPDFLMWEAPFVPREDRSEHAKPLNPQTSRLSFGWIAHLECLAEEFDIDHREYQTSSVVKHFTGKGRYPSTGVKKAATVAACHARGWPVTDDNQADAVAIVMFGEYQIYPEASMQRRIVLRQPTGPLFK